eukprot:scaffold1880_cov115-Isochrysis_galbana.AAC.12
MAPAHARQQAIGSRSPASSRKSLHTSVKDFCSELRYFLLNTTSPSGGFPQCKKLRSDTLKSTSRVLVPPQSPDMTR